ncbi:MAG: hypothetical protein COW89_06760, partial [Nitrospinae bacterium CG22_combo_CG10-13_8_21_14_all_47_10]
GYVMINLSLHARNGQSRHSREGGNPGGREEEFLDSRLRGNDEGDVGMTFWNREKSRIPGTSYLFFDTIRRADRILVRGRIARVVVPTACSICFFGPKTGHFYFGWTLNTEIIDLKHCLMISSCKR